MNTSRPRPFYTIIRELKKNMKARRFKWIRATEHDDAPDKYIYISSRGTAKINIAGASHNLAGKLKNIDHEADDWYLFLPEYCKNPHKAHGEPRTSTGVMVPNRKKHRCMLKIAMDGSTKLCNCCKKCTEICNESAKQWENGDE